MNNPVRVFLVSFILLIVGAALYTWSEYSNDYTTAVWAYRFAVGTFCLGVLGLVINWVRQ